MKKYSEAFVGVDSGHRRTWPRRGSWCATCCAAPSIPSSRRTTEKLEWRCSSSNVPRSSSPIDHAEEEGVEAIQETRRSRHQDHRDVRRPNVGPQSLRACRRNSALTQPSQNCFRGCSCCNSSIGFFGPIECSDEGCSGINPAQSGVTDPLLRRLLEYWNGKRPGASCRRGRISSKSPTLSYCSCGNRCRLAVQLTLVTIA
jgi:hypothetical protein